MEMNLMTFFVLRNKSVQNQNISIKLMKICTRLVIRLSYIQNRLVNGQNMHLHQSVPE